MKNIYFLMLLWMVPPLAVAGPIGIAVHDTTVASNTTVLLPVRVDTSVSGLNVLSYQVDISYTSSVFVIDTVLISGSMTSTWSTTFHLSSGRITVAGAGGTALSGTGVMFFLRARILKTFSLSYGSVSFNSGTLNEGTPATVLRTATITVTPLPVITVSPDNILLTVGDTQQFSVSGGTAPYTWSTTSTSVATISSSGLLTAVHAGFCRVVAVDINGVADTSLQVEVRAFKLSIRDTSYLQGQTFLLPIYISDLSLDTIYSGSLTLTFNQTILTALGTSQTGTLLAGYPTATVHITPSTITVGFAGTTRLNGAGTRTLIYVQFQITNVNPYSTTIQFSNILMNENLPGTNRDGNFTVIPHPTFSVSPSSGTLVYGDSLQFSVGGGATPPIQWSVSDTSLASISAGGLLRVKRGGSVIVTATDAVAGTGSSGAITLYDLRVQLQNAAGKAGDTVNVPIQVTSTLSGFSSFQFSLGYPQGYVTPLDVISTGTLSQNWSVVPGNPVPGTMNIAGASATGILNQGTLLLARFIINQGTGNGAYQVNFLSSIFNEGKPIGLTSNGLINVSNPTDVRDYQTGIPSRFSVEQNYPNPFNPSTIIRYDLPRREHVVVKVYDMIGREISTLVDEQQEAGYKEVSWNASSLPSGTYFYRISAGTFTAVRKTTLLR